MDATGRNIQIRGINSKDDENRKIEVKVFAGMKKAKKAKLFRNRVKTAIFAAAAAILVVSVVMAPKVISYVDSANTVNDFVSSNTVATQSYMEVTDKGTLEDDIPYAQCPRTFSGDTVAYFSDAGDVLDQEYPVMQSGMDDPNFYLHHDVTGEMSELGSVYKDSRNSVSFKDDVTVFYGHNALNGSFFGNMNNYVNKQSFLGNRVGQDYYNDQKALYGEDGNSAEVIDEYGRYRLDLVAAGKNYNALDMINLAGDFVSDEDRQMAYDMINAGSDIVTDVNLDSNSKIVICQTCEDGDSVDYNNSDLRNYAIYKVTQLEKYNDLPMDMVNSGGISRN